MSEQGSRLGRWTAGDYVGLVGGIAGAVGVVVAILSWTEARESRRISAESLTVSQKTYDRAAGRIRAEVEIVATSPKFSDIPDSLKKRLMLSTDAPNEKHVYLRNLDDLARLNHIISVRNIGKEPVDAIRVETRAIHPGVLAELKPEGRNVHYALKQTAADDYVLSGKLDPGDEVSVWTGRGVLEQLVEVQHPDQPQATHIAWFEISCFGRLVGSATFDRPEKPVFVQIILAWEPKGFPTDEIRKRLDGVRATPIIKKAGK